MIKLAKNTKAILTKAFPYVSKTIQSNMRGYNAYLSQFIETRSKDLYDTAPCERIFFKEDDYKNYFNSTHISEDVIKQAISETYYAAIAAFNPRAAKDPLTIAQLCVIRHFYLKNQQKELDMALTLLCFSGKFYPSIHYAIYPQTPPSQYRHIMDYVVNNELNEKYDLKVQGSVIGAIRSIANQWLKAYGSKLKAFDDDDIAYLIQQLHNRIKSFQKNIATVYYSVYKDKDKYMAYSQESLAQDDYRLSDSNSLQTERYVQIAMERINTKGIDYTACVRAADYNVRAEEVKSIMETILLDPKEQVTVREFVTLLITTYLALGTDKSIHDIGFVTYSITAKSNVKDPNLVRIDEILENWLNEKSPAYRKRNKRLPTKNSYHRSIRAYFALVIYDANK